MGFNIVMSGQFCTLAMFFKWDVKSGFFPAKLPDDMDSLQTVQTKTCPAVSTGGAQCTAHRALLKTVRGIDFATPLYTQPQQERVHIHPTLVTSIYKTTLDCWLVLESSSCWCTAVELK